MPQRPSLFFGFVFFFLEFRQSSSGDFVLMYRNGFDGVYGPLGTFLSELFPTNIRYSKLWHLIWLESSEQLLRL
jgi:hypothetical protein